MIEVKTKVGPGIYEVLDDNEKVDLMYEEWLDESLTAEETSYGWCVVDSCNQRFWPDALAENEIEESSNPEETVLQACREGRGTWHW